MKIVAVTSCVRKSSSDFSFAFSLISQKCSVRIVLNIILLKRITILLLFRIYPESPRWLVLKGKLTPAHEIITKYGGKKDNRCDPELLSSMLEDIHNDQVERTSAAKRYTPLDLLRTPKLRRWTIIMSFGW